MSNRKNVLLICTDHWAGAALGCEGHPDIMTPTLDHLARCGIRYDRYYSECPVCIPARRSMMTGLSPKTHGDRVYSDRMVMPDCTTLAQAFRDAGYQAYAVGKLHAYPQRTKLGFDDVWLQEEGRYDFGVVDDYQVWLGEQGYPGMEFGHTVGSNSYHTRTWHLPEYTHPTNWATREMIRMIKRKDPDRPAFYYLSYQFPHPPLVPLDVYWQMYRDAEIEAPVRSEWDKDPFFSRIFKSGGEYSARQIEMARKAYYAQCTHIDAQLRLVIGTLRECGLLNDTIIAFTSDHGDMLFDHNLVAKRSFYEGSARIPFILSGKPVVERIGKSGVVDSRLGVHADLMPTLLDLCGIDIPEHVEGISLLSDQTHSCIYGEIGEDCAATRMLHDGRYKLIYYPYGNRTQLFDVENDPKELHDLACEPQHESRVKVMQRELIRFLHDGDRAWVRGTELVGTQVLIPPASPKYGMGNQRGLHWPAPSGYSNNT